MIAANHWKWAFSMTLTKSLFVGLASFVAAAMFVAPDINAAPVTSTEAEDQPQAMRPDMAAYRQGMRALERGDLDEAEAAFQESVKLNDEVAAPLLRLAEIATARNDMEKTEVNLLLAQDAAPEDPNVYVAMARFYVGQDRNAEAREALERAIEFAPERAELFVELGILLTRNLAKHAEAVEAFDAALAEDDSNARAHLGRGGALLALGDTANAKASLKTASRISPNEPVVWDSLARIAVIEDDAQTAIRLYDRSIAVDPNRIAPYIGRAEVLARTGDFDRAVAAFEAGVEANPEESGGALVRLGIMYQAGDRPDDAIETYERAIAADDTQVVAYNNLASLLAKRGERLDEARAWAERAIELRPEVPHFEDTLGWVLYASGESAEALEHIESAAERAPNEAEIQYHLGILRDETGDSNGAREAFEEALRLNESFPGADDARKRLAALEN